MSNDNPNTPSAIHSDLTNFIAPSDAPLPSNKAMRLEIAQKFRLILASFDRLDTAQDRRAQDFLEAEIERLEAVDNE
jgi:hypothetical protein